MIAFMADGDKLVREAEPCDDLGRAGEQGTNPHRQVHKRWASAVRSYSLSVGVTASAADSCSAGNVLAIARQRMPAAWAA